MGDAPWKIIQRLLRWLRTKRRFLLPLPRRPAPGRHREVRFLGEIANRAEAVERLVDKLAARHGRLSFCYEAGPRGYGIHR